MPSNLPSKEFKKALKYLPNQYESTLWYLFWKGKNFLEGDTLFSYLWLTNIYNNQYPVNPQHKTIIKVKILSVKSNKYILGSIYNYEGIIQNYPRRGTTELFRVRAIVNNNHFNSSKIFNILNNHYPIPSDNRELRGAYYYKTTTLIEGRNIDTIIPLQLINDFFFFCYSTKLNNHILANTISDNVKHLGQEVIDSKKIGLISQNRLEIKKNEALYYGRYFFTKKNTGGEALKLLQTDHLIRMRNGEKKVYFKSKIPFSFDIEFDLLGQKINDNTFLAQRIVGIKSPDNIPYFETDKVVVSVLNDTRKGKGYENDEKTPYNKFKNKYEDIEKNNDYHSSDQSSEMYEVIDQEKIGYFFNEIPPNEVLPKDSNKNKYILDKIINGKTYKGGSVNIFGDTKEPEVTKTNIESELTLYDLIDWNQLVIETLIKICNENGYHGTFIKLNSGNTEVKHNEYDSENNFNILSYTPPGSEKFFKFILFKITFENKTYYYFDKGSNTFAAFFSDVNYSEIEYNKLNLFLKKVINLHNLKWSPIYKEQKLKPDGIIVYQPIEHLVNELEKRLKMRLIF